MLFCFDVYVLMFMFMFDVYVVLFLLFCCCCFDVYVVLLFDVMLFWCLCCLLLCCFDVYVWCLCFVLFDVWTTCVAAVFSSSSTGGSLSKSSTGSMPTTPARRHEPQKFAERRFLEKRALSWIEKNLTCSCGSAGVPVFNFPHLEKHSAMVPRTFG